MNRRLIFPVIMFVMAGGSFAFGIWQYTFAQRVQESSALRTAFIIETIQQSSTSESAKQAMYANIFSGFPSAPSMFGIDVSGSFASPVVQDSCTSDGQRGVCRALKVSDATGATIFAVCGLCNPK